MGKKIASVKKQIDQAKEYSLREAIAIVKKNKFVKFDETLDVAINLGVDPRHSDQMVRGVVSLPAGTGKNVKIAVFCKDDRMAEAKEAGAELKAIPQAKPVTATKKIVLKEPVLKKVNQEISKNKTDP